MIYTLIVLLALATGYAIGYRHTFEKRVEWEQEAITRVLQEMRYHGS